MQTELDQIIDLNPGARAIPRRTADRPFAEILAAADLALTPEAPEPQRTEAVEAPAVAEGVEALLKTRQTTHGEFGDNARVSQSLKRTFRAELGWEILTDTEREAMDMIALKFSRILSGKSLEKQHWEDVVGYAKLAEKLCV